MNSITRKISIASIAALMLFTMIADVLADGNAKRGRVYFKMVCTVCHITEAGMAIPPNTRSMSEWSAYFGYR